MRGGLKKSSALTNGRTCKNWLRREEGKASGGNCLLSEHKSPIWHAGDGDDGGDGDFAHVDDDDFTNSRTARKGAAAAAPKDRQRQEKTSKPTPLICCLKSIRLLAYQYNNACQKCLPYDSQFLNNNLSDMAGNKSMKTIV